ncbi:MAG TPA: methylthioribose kinase [Bacillus bacterium]|nr:methylthioribose kinase [Bacillus sp. (in: firmicutes)]
MIQRFIELGEGYSDLYELLEVARANQHRLVHLMAIHTNLAEKEVSSLIVVLQPTNPGSFQALYICREGIPNPHHLANKRFDLFAQLAAEMGKTIIEFDVKPSTQFADKELYYQYLIGILRLNHYIPPLQ